jgi:hypothetical protein
VFLAGPLSGLIVQPVVGAVSDACRSRLGRRRPFIIGGCVISSVAVLIFGRTREVAGLFTTSGSPTVSAVSYYHCMLYVENAKLIVPNSACIFDESTRYFVNLCHVSSLAESEDILG